jgi:hypothetical protein
MSWSYITSRVPHAFQLAATSAGSWCFFLKRIDAGIGVKEELHLSEVLFLRTPWGGLVKSSGTPAKESTYPSGHS